MKRTEQICNPQTSPQALRLAAKEPHEDKLEMERLIFAAAGESRPDLTSDTNANDKPIASPAWLTNFGMSLSSILLTLAPAHILLPFRLWWYPTVLVRPSLMTNGIERGEKDDNDATGGYRVGEALKDAYTISGRDVGHFVANHVMPGQDGWKNKGALAAAMRRCLWHGVDRTLTLLLSKH